MFLRKLRLLTANNAFFNASSSRCLNIALGTSETEIIDKWKKKFASENISEIDISIKHILNHVVAQNVQLKNILFFQYMHYFNIVIMK